MILRTIESKRLTLVATNAELVMADLEGHSMLAGLLSANVPENWPPDLYAGRAMRITLKTLQADPGQFGWLFWYLLSRPSKEMTPGSGRRASPKPELLGLCGFKGRPDTRGSVEIG